MGSHERGMKHTDATGKTEGAKVLGAPLSPRGGGGGRVPRGTCKTTSKTSKAIEDLRGHLQSLRWCQNPWQLNQRVERQQSALLWEKDK
jgi:hypothetical protein